MERVTEYSTYCGLPAYASAQGDFYQGGKKIGASKDTLREENGCEVRFTEREDCPNHPNLQTTFYDDTVNSGEDEVQACAAKVDAYALWCGLPPLRWISATFRRANETGSNDTIGSSAVYGSGSDGCMIELLTCESNPALAAASPFKDNYIDPVTNQSSASHPETCAARAKQYANYCGNVGQESYSPRPFSSKFIANNRIAASNGAQPDGCFVLLAPLSKCANGAIPPGNYKETTNGADTSPAACLERVKAYAQTCNNGPDESNSIHFLFSQGQEIKYHYYYADSPFFQPPFFPLPISTTGTRGTINGRQAARVAKRGGRDLAQRRNSTDVVP